MGFFFFIKVRDVGLRDEVWKIAWSSDVLKFSADSFGLLQMSGFQTASEYSTKRKQVFHITTGSLEFE